MEEAYVGIDDISKYFKVSVSTVRSWVRTRVLPADTYLKVGRTYRFRKSAVEAALHKRQLEAAEKAAAEAPTPDKDM